MESSRRTKEDGHHLTTCDSRVGALSLPEVERELLRMILDGEAGELPALGLTPADFTVRDYSRIFALCIEQGKPDFVTLYDRCEADGLADVLMAVSQRAIFSGCTAQDYAARLLEASRRRAVVELCGQAAKAASDPTQDGAQVEDMLRAGLDGIAARRGESQTVSLADAFCRLNASLEHTRSVNTGLPGLDDALDGGLRGSALVLLGGLTSSGKSVFCLSIAAHAAQQGARVLLISTEMTAAEVAGRLSVIEGYTPFGACLTSGTLNRGGLSDTDRERLAAAQERLAALADRFKMLDGRLTTQTLRREALRMKRGSGLDLVVVDYLQQLYTGDARTDRDEYPRTASVSWALKALAVELGCPVLAAVQYSRAANAAERPQIHHLRGSGTLEQDANIILTLHRPKGFDDDDGEARSLADKCKRAGLRYLQLYVDKNRNGRTGTRLDYAFDGAHFQIFDAHADFGTEATRFA